MAVYTPNLQLVRYKGEVPRKLWEIKARNIPTLNKGDLVLLDAVTAVLMVKKHGFEMCDNSKLSFGEDFAGESDNETPPNEDETTQEGDETPPNEDETTQEGDETPPNGDETPPNGDETHQGGDETTPNEDDTPQEEYKLPLVSEIMNLSDDEIKAACKYVGIKVSNKKVETLRELLLPYLPQE